MAEIHTTKIYDLFRDIPINRDVDPIRLDSIIKSIQTLDLTRVKPIIVGPDSEIVDGQGRFQACKALGLPIYYTCLLYTSPSPRDGLLSRMPSSA